MWTAARRFATIWWYFPKIRSEVVEEDVCLRKCWQKGGATIRWQGNLTVDIVQDWSDARSNGTSGRICLCQVRAERLWHCWLHTVHNVKDCRDRRESASSTSVAFPLTLHANYRYSWRSQMKIGWWDFCGTWDAAPNWEVSNKGRLRSAVLHVRAETSFMATTSSESPIQEQVAWLDVKLRQQYDMKSEVFRARTNTQSHSALGEIGHRAWD